MYRNMRKIIIAWKISHAEAIQFELYRDHFLKFLPSATSEIYFK